MTRDSVRRLCAGAVATWLLATASPASGQEQEQSTSPAHPPQPEQEERDGLEAPLPTSRPGAVFVHIDTPKKVNLRRSVHGEWMLVCDSPCDTWLAADATEYRISGEGIVASSAFRLVAPSGSRVVLHVDPTSTETREVAKALAYSGPALVLAGVGALLIGPTFCLHSGASPCGVAVAGVVGMAVGLSCLVGAVIADLAAPDDTLVKQEVQRAAAAGTNVSPRPPAWVETETTSRASRSTDVASPAATPLLTVAF